MQFLLCVFDHFGLPQDMDLDLTGIFHLFLNLLGQVPGQNDHLVLADLLGLHHDTDLAAGLDALDRDDPHAMCEELGDVLMQVVFHAQIEKELGRFTMDDVVNEIAQKMVFRHPHVFGGSMQADTSEQVLVNWEVLKRREKDQRSTADAIEAIPHTLPALWRAEKTQSKAAKAGFDWDGTMGALEKLEEEVRELRAALETGKAVDDPHGIREEVGDTLFMAAKVAQSFQVDPEDALHRACDKFDGRFRLVEEAADKPLAEYSQEELLALWRVAKECES